MYRMCLQRESFPFIISMAVKLQKISRVTQGETYQPSCFYKLLKKHARVCDANDEFVWQFRLLRVESVDYGGPGNHERT